MYIILEYILYLLDNSNFFHLLLFFGLARGCSNNGMQYNPKKHKNRSKGRQLNVRKIPIRKKMPSSPSQEVLSIWAACTTIKFVISFLCFTCLHKTVVRHISAITFLCPLFWFTCNTTFSPPLNSHSKT